MENAPHKVVLEKDKNYYWCSCGLSAKKPFCDGAHKNLENGKKSVPFCVDETKERFVCGCGLTKKPPFCDGSHSQ